VRFAKITLPFYGYTGGLNMCFPFGFFILLDLIIFPEIIKILQKSANHAQFKTIQAWRVIYRLNP
jgi:hypothetical protein